MKKMRTDDLLSLFSEQQSLANQLQPFSERKLYFDVIRDTPMPGDIAPADATYEQIDELTGIKTRIHIRSHVVCTCGRIWRVSNKNPYPLKQITVCGHSTCDDCYKKRSTRPANCDCCGQGPLCFRCYLEVQDPETGIIYRFCKSCCAKLFESKI